MYSEAIVAFLHRIPQSNQDAVPLSQLVGDANTDVLLGYALMLQTIGVVSIDSAQNIKATSQTAKYTLESIASFTEHNLTWVDDWKTRGVHRQDTGVFQNGATLLSELENRRIQLLEIPTPSRYEEVVQVLIKRTNLETGQSEFLMQYDANAGQYQFIGGRRSPNDTSLESAAIREIEEEVSNDLVFSQDYQLTCIIPEMIVSATLSPTFGALTQYHFTVYHLSHLKQDIILQDNDCWVAIEDVLSGQIHADDENFTTDNSMYQQMNRLVEGGLANLADSFRI